MAYIEYLDTAEPTPDLKARMERYQAEDGAVENILRIHWGNPDALDAHMALYRQLMFRPSSLSRRQREMLAVVVATANQCRY